jgi:hypothetical protein
MKNIFKYFKKNCTSFYYLGRRRELLKNPSYTANEANSLDPYIFGSEYLGEYYKI